MKSNRLPVIVCFITLVLAQVPISVAFCAERPDKLTTVRIALAARSTTTMPFFVRASAVFFAKKGLEAELILMQAIQTIQATLGKSTHFASATGSAVSAAVRGAEIKVVLAVTDRPSFDLIVQPNITSVQQLRGKKIGTGGIGSLAEIPREGFARQWCSSGGSRNHCDGTEPCHVSVTEEQSHRRGTVADAFDLHCTGRGISKAG